MLVHLRVYRLIPCTFDMWVLQEYLNLKWWWDDQKDELFRLSISFLTCSTCLIQITCCLKLLFFLVFLPFTMDHYTWWWWWEWVNKWNVWDLVAVIIVPVEGWLLLLLCWCGKKSLSPLFYMQIALETENCLMMMWRRSCVPSCFLFLYVFVLFPSLTLSLLLDKLWTRLVDCS